MADVQTLPPNGSHHAAVEKAAEAQKQVCSVYLQDTLIVRLHPQQAAAAQANLHHATQQARVAAIHAAATQAALGSSSDPNSAAQATTIQPSKPTQPVRKTAGRYALNDFGIERT